MEQRKLSIIILAALAVALAAGFIFMVMGIDTPSEGLLLRILLALISIAAAWIASRYYSEWNFRNALRTLALRDTEKVDDLSNEMDRLMVYLQQELEAADYQSPDQELTAKEMRMEDAILLMQTLQSLNERFLNGWEDLIGKEINAHREERRERAASLRDIIRRLQALAPARTDDLLSARSANALALGGQMDSVRSQVRMVASIGVPLRLPRTQASSEGTALPFCPSCGNTVRYRQKAKDEPPKWVLCPSCDSKHISACDGRSFKLDVRKFVMEGIGCPMCGTQSTVELGNWLGSVANNTCEACGLQMTISRCQSGTIVMPSEQTGVVEFGTSDEMVERIRRALPSQPWPKGTSRRIANELGLTHTQVNRIISELIRRGAFGPQIDGRICDLVQEQEASAVKPTD